MSDQANQKPGSLGYEIKFHKKGIIIMGSKIEYGVQRISDGEVLPQHFPSLRKAERFCNKESHTGKFKPVQREVIMLEWEDVQ